MIDIKLIRENRELVKENIKKKLMKYMNLILNIGNVKRR